MTTFVVNLDKNTDRMAFMDEQLKRLGIEYVRIPAVFGAVLTKEERKRNFSAFRSFCASGYKLRNGEIGCALSHCLIYRRIIAEKMPYALILEDDVRIADEMSSVVNDVEAFITPSRAQVVFLSAHGVKDFKASGIEHISGGMCTDGYIITLPAAKQILKSNYPVVTVADKWHRWAKRYGLELYRAWPTAVKQDNATFGTDISSEKICYGKGIRMGIHKIFRVVECCLDVAMYWVTGR